jgi:hypothetical protein
LALAHHIQRAIDRGVFASQSDVARRLGLTTARVTQVMNLLLLAPDLQERLLALEAVDGVEPVSEKVLRRAPSTRCWGSQRATVLPTLFIRYETPASCALDDSSGSVSATPCSAGGVGGAGNIGKNSRTRSAG